MLFVGANNSHNLVFGLRAIVAIAGEFMVAVFVVAGLALGAADVRNFALGSYFKFFAKLFRCRLATPGYKK
jgi:hypothetical protein